MKERGEEECTWEGYSWAGAEHRSKAIEDKKAGERSGGQIWMALAVGFLNKKIIQGLCFIECLLYTRQL